MKERFVQFHPAFDRRDPDPAKNYGVHGVEIRFVLRGEDGAVQFLLFTNWQLPHVKEEWQRHERPRTWLYDPMPGNLGYHAFKNPRFTSQTEGECDLSPTGKCWYDGSSLSADPIFERLLREGDEGVWAVLEHFYTECFSVPNAEVWT